MFSKLNLLLTKRDKQVLIVLLGFSVFISVIETVGIGVILPFISVASNFTLIHTNKYYQYVYKLFHFHSEINFVLAFGVGLIFFYIFRSLINLVYFYSLNKFSQGRYHLLAYRLFENLFLVVYRHLNQG